jgi:rod shape-determining protein MreC
LVRPSTLLATVLAPVERGTADLWRAGAGLTQGIGSLWSLQRQNAELRAALRRDQYELTQQADLQTQLRNLEGVAKLQSTSQAHGQGSGIPVRVIARTPSGWFDTVVINRGSAEGVQAGMVAITVGGLVGVVEQGVARHSATVRLETNPNFGVGIAVSGGAGVQGVATGRIGATTLVATFFSPTADVHVGDSLVTSGLATPGVGGGFPAGLPVGRVIAVRTGSFGLERQAVVATSARLASLQDMLLLPVANPG